MLSFLYDPALTTVNDHWDDPEGWCGEGGGRRVQDGEHMYTCGAQVKFAAALGVSVKKVSAWEHGKAVPDEAASSAPQFKSINSSALNFLYSPTLTSIHDYWKNHSFD